MFLCRRLATNTIFLGLFRTWGGKERCQATTGVVQFNVTNTNVQLKYTHNVVCVTGRYEQGEVPLRESRESKGCWRTELPGKMVQGSSPSYERTPRKKELSSLVWMTCQPRSCVANRKAFQRPATPPSSAYLVSKPPRINYQSQLTLSCPPDSVLDAISLLIIRKLSRYFG